MTQDNLAHEAPGQNKVFELIVNGRKKQWTEKKISYIEVIRLAFDNPEFGEKILYSVTYMKGPESHEGDLVDGESASVKDGMIFNVKKTDRS